MLKQTRGSTQATQVSFQEAILNPSACFGGLFAPKTLPQLTPQQLEKLAALSYADLAKEIFGLLELDINPTLLQQALDLYQHFDHPTDPAPLVSINPDLCVQELYHGPTRAFKDMALQPFGHILSTLARERKEHYLILVATSGDTGPATLHSFANKPNISVVCLYPSGGTSDVQRLQMTTADSKNLKVLGIEGDFDDAQSALKQLLNNEDFRAKLQSQNILLSAANSVNFGRIAFQIIYHAYASLKFKHVDIIVPSGNFGNALGGFYAKLMGFPIRKIIIASNINNILTDFITTGVYDLKNRSLQKTQSPAMDILKSSNVERVLFALYGDQRTKELLESLENTQRYSLTPTELATLQTHFHALYCSDKQGEELIAKYAQKGYLFDPHTATAFNAYENLQQDSHTKIILSTAEWTKFAPTVAKALGSPQILADKDALEFISQKMKLPIHPQIRSLFEQKETHTAIIAKENIAQTILDWLMCDAH